MMVLGIYVLNIILSNELNIRQYDKRAHHVHVFSLRYFQKGTNARSLHSFICMILYIHICQYAKSVLYACVAITPDAIKKRKQKMER